MHYRDSGREIQVDDEVFVRNGSQTFYGTVVDVTETLVNVMSADKVQLLIPEGASNWRVVPKAKPIPSKKNAVIKIEDRIYIRTKPNLSQPWQEAGRDFVQSDMAVQAGADRYGFEVIFEGRDEA